MTESAVYFVGSAGMLFWSLQDGVEHAIWMTWTGIALFILGWLAQIIAVRKGEA